MEKKQSFISLTENPHADAQQLTLAPGIEVTIGIPLMPTSQGRRSTNLYVPTTPHIYKAATVEVISHLSTSYPFSLTLHDIIILEGHGYRDQNNTWRFQNGQDVVATVNAFHSYAQTHNVPDIKVLIACNSSKNNQKISAENTILLEQQHIVFVDQGDALVRHTFSPHDGVKVSLRADGAFAKTLEQLMYH